MMYRFLVLFLTVFSGMLATPQIIDAAPSYTVAPLVVNQTLEGRQVYNAEIKVTNTGTQPVTIFPQVNNISLAEGGDIQDFKFRSQSDATASLAAWIEISRRGVLLPKNESITIPFIIRMHPTPKPGEYHAFVGFGYGRTADDAKRMVAQGRAPGTTVTVTVADERTTVLRLSKFFIDRFVTSLEAESVTYTLSNPGDTPIAPTGDIIFYNGRGKEVGAIPVNPDNVVLPPGEELELTSQPEITGVLGKYKGYLSVQYGSQVAAVQDTVFFYYIPIKYMLIALAIIVILVVVVSIMVHRRYFDEEEFDSDFVPVTLKDGTSDTVHHDIDLKKKDENS